MNDYEEAFSFASSARLYEIKGRAIAITPASVSAFALVSALASVLLKNL